MAADQTAVEERRAAGEADDEKQSDNTTDGAHEEHFTAKRAETVPRWHARAYHRGVLLASPKRLDVRSAWLGCRCHPRRRGRCLEVRRRLVAVNHVFRIRQHSMLVKVETFEFALTRDAQRAGRFHRIHEDRGDGERGEHDRRRCQSPAPSAARCRRRRTSPSPTRVASTPVGVGSP